MVSFVTTATDSSSTPAPRHQRVRSLSLIAGTKPSASPLLSLPSELLFDIFDLCIAGGKPTRLATVSKLVANFIEAILYRSVILDSSDAVGHFHATISAKSPHFLATHVKRLTLTWAPFPNSRSCQQIWDIIVACSNVKSLTLPPGYHPLSLASIVQARGSNSLTELCVASYDEVDYMGRCTSLKYIPTIAQAPASPSAITHLRVCEPSIAWCPPATIIQSFGDLPSLTHLQLARRAHANEDNDQTFLEDVGDILMLHPRLQVLAVSVFPCLWAEEDAISKSTIWIKLQEMAAEDPRLIVIEGEYGGWRDESKGLVSSPGGPSAFWSKLETRQQK